MWSMLQASILIMSQKKPKNKITSKAEWIAVYQQYIKYNVDIWDLSKVAKSSLFLNWKEIKLYILKSIWKCFVLSHLQVHHMLPKDIVEFKVFYLHLINKLIIYDIANSIWKLTETKNK
jgi:hypothetical protein